MEFSADEKQEAKELFESLKVLYSDKVDLEIAMKERENALKEEFADACDIKDKKGEIKPNKVKTPLMVQAIIDVKEEAEANKYELQVDEIDRYKTAIRNKSVSSGNIDAYLSNKEDMETLKANIKETIAETTLLSKEVLDGILELGKQAYAEIKAQKFEDAGFKAPSTKSKDDEDARNEILAELSKILR